MLFRSQQTATELKVKPEEIWKELDDNLGSFESVFDLFQAVVEGTAKLPLQKPALDVLGRIINEKLKPVSVSIKGTLELVTYEPNGVALIQHAFKENALVVLGMRCDDLVFCWFGFLIPFLATHLDCR